MSLANIVTLGLYPDNAVSLSGLQLIDAPGISVKSLNDTANETYVNGINLALKKKALALTLFQNDFIGALQVNKVVTTITDPIYDSAVFNPSISVGASNAQRGTMLIPNPSYRGSLRTLNLKTIQLFPLNSGDVTIHIYDGFTETTYPPVAVTANMVNTFQSDYVVNQYSTGIKILLTAPGIAFASSQIICGQGCNNSMPNPCGYANGWDGVNKQRNEGYGINVQFYCHCDYTKILTDMAKGLVGELIWKKWQIEVFKEAISTDRFNFWLIYGKDDLEKNILPQLQNEYVTKWNMLMDGLFAILQTYRDDCLQCRGIRWSVNI